MIESPVGERSEVVIDHTIYPLSENCILRLKKLVSWISPFLDRLLYESLGNDKRIVVRKLPSLGSTFDISGRAIDERKITLTAVPSS